MSDHNRFYLDKDALKAALKPYFIKAMDEIEDALIGIMKEEIGKSKAGATDWHEEMQGALKRVEESMTNDYIERKIGLAAQEPDYDYIRAMVVTFGAGSAVGRAPIHAGPYGRIVYNNDLDGQHPSRVVHEYDLPAEFNQKGYDWVTNAERRMGTLMQNKLDAVWGQIPDSVFTSCLRVIGG